MGVENRNLEEGRREGLERLRHFVDDRIWRVREGDVSRPKLALARLMRIGFLAGRGFGRHRCALRASGLTFYTLLSIVPLVALAFAIAKGFGFERIIERQLYMSLPGQEAVLERVMEMARSLLEQTQGGAVAGAGLLMLIWAVIKVLMHMEDAMNEIWGVATARTLKRKLSDYLSIMFISPLLVIISSSLNVYITTQVTFYAREIALLSYISPLLYFMLKLLSYGLVWLLFILTYLIIPNTQVAPLSGIIGGLIAGSVYVATQWVYIRFQIGVSTQNAIYGSLAALPLFLVWLNLSWTILLLGAEIAAAHQFHDAYGLKPGAPDISFSMKQLICLRVVHLITRRFKDGLAPLTLDGISGAIGAHPRSLSPLLNILVAEGVLSRTDPEKSDQPAYQPARDVRAFTLKFVLDALGRHGQDDIPIERGPEVRELSRSLERFDEAVAASPANRRLGEI